jgi:ABC-type nitrate/sulfonate/bicarbonate transport system ATPase subunit
MANLSPLAQRNGSPPQANGHPKLSVHGLSKVFEYQSQPLTVLDKVDIELKANEFICLVGSSGCGKSALLKIIAGLMSPSQGEVRVEGEAVEGPGSDRGMVFQSYSLFPWLTVAQNIEFGLKLQGMPKQERQDRIAYYLDVVGLSRFAQALPKQLSGGMKQRAAIARALANEPEVMLMDEPFGALDAQTKEQLQQFMQEIWERTHMTILMVTHDVEEAIFLSHRVYIMDSHPGRIRENRTIPLPEHRELAIKLTPEFLQLKRDITDQLGH